MAEPAFLELRGIGRSYTADAPALVGVDLTVRAGERVAIVGPSGSGKSTLLNVLGLMDSGDEGSVLIDGEPLATGDDRARTQRRRADFGFVFQSYHLMPALTARENVALGLRYAGWPERAIAPRVERALAAVGLEHRIDALARTLSGGEMQRVAIARAVARPTRIILADEPTGNLDSRRSVEVITLLEDAAALVGAALVVVTHEEDIAAHLDRVVELRDGRIQRDRAVPRVPAPRPGAAQPSVSHAPGAETTTAIGPPVATASPGEAPDPSNVGALTDRPVRRLSLVGRTRRFVAESLRSQRFRTVSGVASTAMAVALAIGALGLGQTASAQVSSLFDAQRARQVTAEVVFDEASTASDPGRVLDLPNLSRFPGVDGAALWESWSAVDLGGSGAEPVTAQFVRASGNAFTATDSTVRWSRPGPDDLAPGEVVIGETLAQRLGIAQIDLQPEITVNGVPVRIAGLLSESRDGSAVGSVFVGEDDFGLGPPGTATIYSITAPGAARGIAERLPALVDPYGQATITTAPVLGADADRGALESSVAASLAVLTAVASLASLLAIVCVNLLNVSSRRNEFGVRRAFGASRRELAGQTMAESTAIGAIGGLVGLVTGFLAIMAVTVFARWSPVFDPRLAVAGIGAGVVFGVLSGLVPAIVASRVEPAQAVRS